MKRIKIKVCTTTKELEDLINKGWDHYHTVSHPDSYVDKPNYFGEPRQFWTQKPVFGGVEYFLKKSVKIKKKI